MSAISFLLSWSPFFFSAGYTIDSFNRETTCGIICRNEETLCKENCLWANISSTKDAEELGFKLICREETNLVITWNNSTNSKCVLAMQEGSSNQWILLKTQVSDEQLITGLRPGAYYKFKIFIFMDSNWLQYESYFFRTLSEDTMLSDIKRANITNIWFDGSYISAVLQWDPILEQTCTYYVLMWLHGKGDVIQLAVQLNELYNMVLERLEFSTDYRIAVYAFSTHHESKKLWVNFRTPSCEDLNVYNLLLCVPDAPNNLTVHENIKANCSISVTWDVPKIFPEYYMLKIQSIENNKFLYKETLPGNLTCTEIGSSTLSSHYIISLVAVAAAGESFITYTKVNNSCVENIMIHSFTIEGNQNFWGKKKIIVGYLITLTLLVFILFLTTHCLKKHQKKGNVGLELEEENVLNKDAALNKVPPVDEIKVSEQEISPEMLQISEFLGEGEFGIVHKAVLTPKFGEPFNVAIKMLHDHRNPEGKNLLEKETALMKSVGKHRNIVSLIGYSESFKFLVVEFCSLGNLQNYLRQTWKTIWSAKEELRNNFIKSKQDALGKLSVSNILYEKSELERKQLALKLVDLISFARQTAIGMEFLSENRVIHRDLAARNVLVCADLTVKISDFGLSRDVYEQNMYWKKSSSKLPVKWMAIECLLHQVFTTQSDVWSFGVLMWEIMTLGGCPYPTVQTRELFRLLQEGYRMEKPAVCSETLYEIMLRCWDANPNKRPTFSSLVTNLDEIMSQESPHKYLDLESLQASTEK